MRIQADFLLSQLDARISHRSAIFSFLGHLNRQFRELGNWL